MIFFTQKNVSICLYVCTSILVYVLLCFFAFRRKIEAFSKEVEYELVGERTKSIVSGGHKDPVRRFYHVNIMLYGGRKNKWFKSYKCTLNESKSL